MVIVILVARGRAFFGLHQKSRLLAASDSLSMRKEFVSDSQPIRFVIFLRLDSKHAQGNGLFMNRGLLMLDLPRGHNS